MAACLAMRFLFELCVNHYASSKNYSHVPHYQAKVVLGVKIS
jgi:hypothetical protein